MELLKKRILEEGIVKAGDILKVDSFLNHQMDPAFMMEMAKEIQRLYKDEKIDKVVTIEASGIALAIFVGYLLNAPVVFAKKSKTSNLDNDCYHTIIHSYTHNNENQVMISKRFLHEGENILVVDDFLASGCALEGLFELCHQANAKIVGAAVAVEKVYQEGGNQLRKKGYRVEALASIRSMNENSIEFAD